MFSYSLVKAGQASAPTAQIWRFLFCLLVFKLFFFLFSESVNRRGRNTDTFKTPTHTQLPRAAEAWTLLLVLHRHTRVHTFPDTSRPDRGGLLHSLLIYVCAGGRCGPARLTLLMYHFSPAAAKYESTVAAEWTLTPLGDTPAFTVVENRSPVP